MDDVKIEKEFAEIKRMISEMNANLSLSVNNINLCLNGQYGQKGLVGIVAEHNRYINSDKKFKAQLFGGFTVVTVLWGILIKFWDKIFGSNG